ncbi:MAG TPA: hypothetical protein VFR07_02955 [Mycobacteriales bacterium]|nr:hypothetical protein [Mycobacteriales bacterium]
MNSGRPVSKDLARRVEVGEIVDRLGADDVGSAERGRLLARLTAALLSRARAAGGRAVLTGRALADAVAELAPAVPVRDLDALRARHDGLTGDALAEALVGAACRTTAGIGAAGGALSAAQLAAPPSLLVSPVQVAAETLAVVLVEIKLVAELHVVHGSAAAGPPAQQAAEYLHAWVARSGVDDAGVAGVSAVLKTAARQQLRGRLVRRFGRNLSTLAPFLAGAVAGAELNRRETRALGDAVREDLRRRLPGRP